MRQIIIIATLTLISFKTLAYNSFWIRKDKLLITNFVKLDKNNPKEIEQYFSQISAASFKKENLGFGWTMWTTGTAGGYTSISAKFFYYRDSLLSYSLTPHMPEEKGLIKRYKKWYNGYFDYSGSEIQPYKFNEAAILRPLKEYNGNWDNAAAKIINYMTPNSGTMFGYIGENRQAFFEIKDSLTADQVRLMMYAINPATRLTAIEYFLQNEALFPSSPDIYEWIEIVFKETPTIKTRVGCFIETETPQSLFPQYYINKYYR